MLKIANTLGIRAIYCPYLLPDQRPADAAGWKAFGERLENAGKPFRDAGLDFGWHNHDFEFVALPDGSIPQDHIFAGGPTFRGKRILPGLSVAAPIRLRGSRNTAIASPPFM